MAYDPGVKIPLQKIEDFINCTICLNVMKKTVTTTCCHRFCEKCIKEWVDRNNKCPCCNSALSSKNLTHDCQFDSLIEMVLKEKEESEKAYFDEVCMQPVSITVSKYTKEALVCDPPTNCTSPITTNAGPSTTNAGPSTTNAGSSTNTISVESVVRKHLQKSLSEHGGYFKTLQNEYERKKKILEAKIENEEQSDSVCTYEVNERIQAFHKDIENVETEYSKCKQLVAETYDRYLTEHIPSLSILPVSVSLYIVEKNIKFPEITFRPEMSISELKDVIKNAVIQKHDAITEWTNLPIYLFSPLEKSKTRQNDEFYYKNIIENMEEGTEQCGVTIINWSVKPVLNCQMKPGSEIVLYKSMKLESDQPPVCYINKHCQGVVQTVDYYKCQDCGFNWICKSCNQFCHKGHKTSVHVLNNKPTWACCYCPKKKKCCI